MSAAKYNSNKTNKMEEEEIFGNVNYKTSNNQKNKISKK